MKHSAIYGSLFVGFLAIQLEAQTTHRFIAVGAFTALLGLWAALLREIARQRAKPYWTGVVLAIAISLVVAIPPATSKDMNSYALYGRMVAEYSASPYTHEPVDFAGDPWFSRTSRFWEKSPSVYGPVFTGLSTGIMGVAGDSVLKARLGFQGLAAMALLGCVALAAKRIGHTRSMVLVGLNPLLLTFGVNDAHCDVLIGLCILVAVLALERGRFIVGGIALAAAASIKIATLPALAGALLWIAWSGEKRTRKAVLILLGFIVTFGGSLLTAGGKDVLTPLQSAAQRHTRFSVWNPLHQLIHDHASADVVTSLAANTVVVFVGLTLLWRHRKDTDAAVIIAIGLVTYQVFGAYVLSWYAAWSLPALALRAKSRTFVVCMAHGSWVAIAYFSGYVAILVVAIALVLGVGKWLLFENSDRNHESLAAP